jgi:ribosomal protein S18 acetylase RimI-like enzyme
LAGAVARTAPEHRRALAFERATYARAAEHPWGLSLRDPRFRRAHMLNQLWVTATSGVTAAELVAELDALQGDVPDRVAFLEDDPLGAALAPELQDRGFACEPHLYMALRRPRDRAPAPGLAREATPAEHAALEAAVTRQYPHGSDPAVVADLSGARAALRDAVERSLLVIGPAGGTPAAHASLLCGDGVAQLEDVATLTAARGRGLARAVCSLALESAAGAELTFLVADAEDWPRELYAKLGFDPVGRSWAVTRMGG